MAKSARIALLNWRDPWHSLAGGSERYAWEFARGLVEAGHRVQFVTARDDGQTARDRIDGVEVIRRGGQYTFYLWAALHLVLRRRRLDLVVDPSCGIPCFSPLFVRRRTPVVLVMHHVHQQQFVTYFPPLLARFGQWLEAWLMPRVYRRTRTVAVSQSTVDEMRDVLGWRGPVEILANGTDLGPANLDAPVSGRLVVLGRLVTHKRVTQVVEAVGRLRREGRSVTVDVVGRGPEAPSVEHAVQALGLRESVVLHGYLDEGQKFEVVRRAQLHVCGSDSEGWGQVVVEAAGLGVPTLARDVPGLRDSVVPGVTGWLLPDTDGRHLGAHLADGIAQALDVLDDPDAQATMRRTCRAWAERFTWEHMRAHAVRVVDESLAYPMCGTSQRTRS